MPFFRKPRSFVPLHTLSEKKSIKNGQRHAIFTPNFDRYVGDWLNDKKSGKGTFLTNNGKLYEGDWLEGYRHGFGTLSRRLPSGIFSLVYRGDWVRGKPEGTGWRYYTNGDVYFGFWLNGHRHGYGKMWYTNGNLYVGYWNMNKKDGLGMLVQVNGNRYEGTWSADKKHGLGRYYHMHTGQLQEGCWSEDVCVNSKISDILVRQACDMPTQYPIPQVELRDSLQVLERSELWMKQKLRDFDKNLQHCIDQMV